jgi:hypothetical protein
LPPLDIIGSLEPKLDVIKWLTVKLNMPLYTNPVLHHSQCPSEQITHISSTLRGLAYRQKFHEERASLLVHVGDVRDLVRHRVDARGCCCNTGEHLRERERVGADMQKVVKQLGCIDNRETWLVECED